MIVLNNYASKNGLKVQNEIVRSLTPFTYDPNKHDLYFLNFFIVGEGTENVTSS